MGGKVKIAKKSSWERDLSVASCTFEMTDTLTAVRLGADPGSDLFSGEVAILLSSPVGLGAVNFRGKFRRFAAGEFEHDSPVSGWVSG